VEGIIDSFTIAPGYRISRIIKGGWQLAEGHSSKNGSDPIADMFAFVEAGITTFDCADIYTGVETLIGSFVQANRKLNQPYQVKIHTKFVPDYNRLGKLNKASVEEIINRSLQRLGMERLDMVQFHWWDYAVPGYLETIGWLKEIQQMGKIHLLSTTNFNVEKTREIVDAGFDVATAQVQYSLLDPRPEGSLINYCKENDINLLCYGTLAGGFLSDRWLGISEPHDLTNRSLIKYKLMIDEAGGWDVFQSLLRTLKKISDKHTASISTIAINYILNKPQVAAAIVGARNANHIQDYKLLFQLKLDDEDRQAIGQTRKEMNTPPDDVFDLERQKEGKHGRIMKYNLNVS